MGIDSNFPEAFNPMSPKIRKTAHSLSLVAALTLSFLATAIAQETGKDPKPAKLFESEDTLAISFTGPWKDMVQNEKEQGAYPARVEYTDELGNTEALDVTVERRGVTRQRVCRIPPIKIRFEKGSAKGTTFRGQGSLKMVTHCQKSSSYQQYYILEMLAYRMYNLLTDYSFRVRPLTVTYFQADAEEDSSSFSFFKKETSAGPVFAFLIEDDKDVANRFDLHKMNVPRISPTQLDVGESALLGLFQYMIGNVDWAAIIGPQPDECCHNIKLIGPEPTRPEDKLFAVPYDFDSSGLVDARYATPNEGLPIRNVRQRLYRGYCVSNPGMEDARRNFLDNEQAIYDLVKTESRLKPRSQKKALKYLEDFYDIIRDDKDFQKEIVGECRG